MFPKVYVAPTYACSSDMDETLFEAWFWYIGLENSYFVSRVGRNGEVRRLAGQDFCAGRHCDTVLEDYEDMGIWDEPYEPTCCRR